VLERIRRARQQAGVVRRALQSASRDEINGCIPALEEAMACLRSVERELRQVRGTTAVPQGQIDSWQSPIPHASILQTDGVGGHREQIPLLCAELEALRKELDIARRLVAQGSAFYAAWARVLGSATWGYTPVGSAALVEAAGSVYLKG
jgi:hypothetical protein